MSFFVKKKLRKTFSIKENVYLIWKKVFYKKTPDKFGPKSHDGNNQTKLKRVTIAINGSKGRGEKSCHVEKTTQGNTLCSTLVVFQCWFLISYFGKPRAERK